MALQQRLGVLSEQRIGVGRSDPDNFIAARETMTAVFVGSPRELCEHEICLLFCLRQSAWRTCFRHLSGIEN